MKIIDAHIHIGQWSEIFLSYGSTIDEAVKEMKLSGVDAALAMPTDRTSNSELFEGLQKTDFEFYYNAWIDPADPGLDNFLKKNISEISAFKIHPSIQRMKITDEKYKKYLDLASSKNIPVVVHCGRWKEMAGYELCLEAAREFPKLKLILAHLGGDQPGIFMECADAILSSEYKNVFLGTESVREFYFVNELVKKVTPQRVIFGSDYNLGLPATYIPIIDRLKISENEKEMIFSGNILRLINKE
ncbi:amidohydrolase family protein [soil metagenome]